MVADMQPGEGSDDDLIVVRREGTKLIVQKKSFADAARATPRVEFEAAEVLSLDGTGYEEDGTVTKAKMELTSDKSKMILTLLPEASEPMTVTLVRAKGESWLGK
jgi:hypothetical protein